MFLLFGKAGVSIQNSEDKGSSYKTPRLSFPRVLSGIQVL
jgi:hypothetical protein